MLAKEIIVEATIVNRLKGALKKNKKSKKAPKAVSPTSNQFRVTDPKTAAGMKGKGGSPEYRAALAAMQQQKAASKPAPTPQSSAPHSQYNLQADRSTDGSLTKGVISFINRTSNENYLKAIQSALQNKITSLQST